MNKRVAMAVTPLILVNLISVIAQFEFWHAHLPWPVFAAAGFALALESIAIYLAYHAHIALVANDSAFRLRTASYVFGAGIGILNGSHYLNNGRLTAAAIGIGLCSASSPWLWGIHSRRESRDRLIANGLIEQHAVRLGFTRVFWHPAKSLSVFRMAAWTGESSPAAAITAWEELRESASEDIPRMTLDTVTSKADAVRVTLAELGESQNSTAVAEYLREHGWDVEPAYVRQIRANGARKRAAERRKGMHALGARPLRGQLPAASGDGHAPGR